MKPKTNLKERKEQREKRKFDFERNSRTIFIGNLPSTYDHKDVVKLFKQYGPVESARIRSVIPEKEKMPPKVAEITKRIHPKIDSVNAYLVFKKDDDNEKHIMKALGMNGKLVDEHHIRVDRAQHPNSKRLTLTSRKKSVFVGNLRFDIRDDDLIKHFEKIAPVDYVRLVRDRATGLGKGFGFVKFKERAPVKEALKLNDTQFQGRDLRVKKVDEDAPALAKGSSEKEADNADANADVGDADDDEDDNVGEDDDYNDDEDDDDKDDEDDDDKDDEDDDDKDERGARGGSGRSYSDGRNGREDSSNFRGGRTSGRGRGRGRGGSQRSGPSGPFRGGFKSGGFGRGGAQRGRGGGPRRGGPRPRGKFTRAR